LSVIGNDGYDIAVPGTAVELSDHEDKEDPTLRLHHLLVGPGVFHIIVFTSDMLHPKNIRSGTTIKSVLATTAQDIGKEVEDRLVTWQARYTPSSLSVSVDSNINVKASHQGKMFMVHVISATAVDAAAASGLATKSHGEGRLYLDKDGVLHGKYGVAAAGGPGSIFVLRPDSYVGYRVVGAGRPAWQDVDDYLSSILTSIA
jgi:hypothetical protein